MPDDSMHGLADRGRIEIERRLEHQRLVVMVWIGRHRLEEAALDRRQRHRPAHRRLLRANDVRGTGERREFRDRLLLEHLPRCEFETFLLCAGDQLETENRVASKLEKAVMDPDAIDTEQFL